MSFKAAFIAHVPDADPEKNRTLTETKKYKLFVNFVKNQEQAVSVCKKLVKEEGVLNRFFYAQALHTGILQSFQRQ